MSLSTALLLWTSLGLVAACGREPPPAPAAPVTRSTTPLKVAVPMFDEVAIDDGAVLIMDGGIHGVQGHTLAIPATGAVQWERRLDGMQPSGKAGKGEFALTADEARRVAMWRDQLWKRAPTGNASFSPPPSEGVPRWVWAIVLRQGDQARVLSGGAMESPAGAPSEAADALRWLVTRVDAASQAAP